MSEPLKSHPDRTLFEHISDVESAAQSILAQHTSDEARDDLVYEIVHLHDLGKASSAFQQYIRDPAGYRGNPNKKAHTPLGFAVALLLGDSLDKSEFWKLCASSTVLGHHTGFPNSNRLTDALLMNDEWAEIIEDQATATPAQEVSELTGFALESLLSNPELCDAAYDVAEELVNATVEKACADLQAAVDDRLNVQFIFSVLLEADKAFLALSQAGRSTYRSPRETNSLSPDAVESYLQDSDDSRINELRTQARGQVLKTFHSDPERRLWTLTLPTGLGKTLTAAELALSLRERYEGVVPRIFVVLPFLSIIDQTAQVYGDLLEGPPPSTLMQSHSLSERTYDTEQADDAEFFLDTWNSEIVITTFDQFLLSLLGDRTRHQMRFHNLADSILIFDEVQTLPTPLWDLLSHAMEGLTTRLNSTAVFMSATQPGFVSGARELTEKPEVYYQEFDRYQLVLKHRQRTRLEDLIENLLARGEELGEKRVLVTLNTRASAREVRNALDEHWGAPVYFLTADVTPKDRLAAIEKIKSAVSPCLVVSTQVIEAGVDIDMDLVIRDFAPLDSLIQIAGRCNRHGTKSRTDIEVYSLEKENGRLFAEMVYKVDKGSPDVRLQITREALEQYEVLPEQQILTVCEDYFARVREGKDTGRQHTLNWASLSEKQPDIRRLLRGEHDRQVQLIVAERDEGNLQAGIEEALDVPDRWERRRALQQLSGRIAQVTVSVWARENWHPGQIAYPIGNYDPSAPLRHPWWIVHPGNYSPETGLNMEGDVFL